MSCNLSHVNRADPWIPSHQSFSYSLPRIHNFVDEHNLVVEQFKEIILKEAEFLPGIRKRNKSWFKPTIFSIFFKRIF